MKANLKGFITITLLFLISNLSAQTVHFKGGTSIRNGIQGKFYKMVSWDDSKYQEFAYWSQNSNGTVIEFMNFRVMFPIGYNPADKTKRYPMIVMLHGAGESGRKWTDNFQYELSDPRYDNNGHQLLHGGSQHRDAINRSLPNARAFPGIVIFPQVSFNGAWDINDRRMAILIIEYMISQYQVDPFRISMHGLSNGAKATWEFGFERPDLVSAMLPMSGVGSNLEAMTDILVTTPIWLFQGGLDQNPSPGAANQWVGKLIEKGGNPRYSLYQNLGHGTWNTAYNENDFFSWMLIKNKRRVFVFGDSNPSTASIESPVKMGISEGFLAYQWTRNGIDISGATGRYFTATKEGVYRVKFQQRINSQWAESYPVNLSTIDYPDDLIYIPDANFKSLLISNNAINTNGDSEIQRSEASVFKGQISANGQKITSLVGIEAFTALTDLRIINNLLTTLDLTANTELIQLHCQTNDITSLNLSTNTKLIKFRCFDNELTYLNIQNGNTNKLDLFEATGNHLNCIQVDNVNYAVVNFTSKVDAFASFSTSCTAEAVVTIPNVNFKNALLNTPSINKNGDQEIQISEAIATTILNINSKNISDLRGIEAFSALTHLYCGDNQLTTIDVRQNTELVELHVENNLLTIIQYADRLDLLDATNNRLVSLDISDSPVNTLLVGTNKLASLNLKTGGFIGYFFAKGNPDLACILVDDVAFAQENYRDNVDSMVEFSIDCAGGSNLVFIPDVKLKAALLAIPEININGDGEIQYSEAAVYSGMINVGSKGISSAVGLQAFTKLTDLRVLNNNLTVLDVSKNTELIQLHCQKNLLTRLDISANKKITKLRVFNNKLTALNIKNGNNHNFALFEADINNLTCIQVDNVPYAVTNFTSKVDPGVVFNTNCSGVAPVVNFMDPNFKNALLSDASINTNGDAEIQLTEAESVTIMNVASKSITNLFGINAFSSLTHLNCSGNQLISLDVRFNTSLVELHCQYNKLNSLLFLTGLNVLDASFNQLSSFDISATPLSSLKVDNNQLTYLNLSGSTLSVLEARINPDLTCILVDDVVYAEANFAGNVDPDAIFSTTCSSGPAVVNIPDIIFKNALLANPAINTNGDGEIQYTEASAFTGLINVGSSGISSVTGIEAFTALTDLRVLNNKLTSLDVSQNTELIQLHCQKNQLKSLDISANTKITKFRVFNNQLTSLNIQNGNNHNFSLFEATDNSALSCAQVDNVAYAVANFTSKFDPGVAFSTDCPGGSGARIAGGTQLTPALEEPIVPVNVYPNPFENQITVQLGVGQITPFIKVYDLLGRVYTPDKVTLDEHQVIIELSRLRKGLYILQVDQKNYRIVKE